MGNKIKIYFRNEPDEYIIIDNIYYKRVKYKNGNIHWYISEGEEWCGIWNIQEMEEIYKNIKRSQKLERILR